MGWLGTAPITAGVVAEHTTKMMAAGGASSAGLGSSAVQGAVAAGGNAPRVIRSLAEYLTVDRVKQIKQRANQNALSHLDPDLLYWNVPMATKVREQRRRNYDRVLEEESTYFERVVRINGVFKDWD
jgi:hypothetical protein